MAKKQVFDLQSVAQLARIELTKEEESDFGSQLQKVLGYFDTIDEDKKQNPKAKSSESQIQTVLREDKLKECLPREEALKNAPATERGYVKVKAVFGDEVE